MKKYEFLAEVAKLQDELRSFQEDVPAEVIESTAQRLEGLNYAPATILPVPEFLRLTRFSLLTLIERLVLEAGGSVGSGIGAETTEKYERVLRDISVLVFNFRNVLRLRDGDAEAWDEVDELYVHD